MKRNRFLIACLVGLTPLSLQAEDAQDLNCDDAYTTRDINRCMGIELKQAEALLEQYLKTSFTRYTEDESIRLSIRTAQQRWQKYRETQCASVYETWRTGSIRNTMYLNCSIRLTKQRTWDVWMDYLTYADSSEPVLPEPARD